VRFIAIWKQGVLHASGPRVAVSGLGRSRCSSSPVRVKIYSWNREGPKGYKRSAGLLRRSCCRTGPCKQ